MILFIFQLKARVITKYFLFSKMPTIAIFITPLHIQNAHFVSSYE